MEGARIVCAELDAAFAASITDSQFFPVGVFEQPVRISLVQNFTDQTIIFSYDGITNNFVLPPNGFLVVDIGTNKGSVNTAAIPSGQGIFAKALIGLVPTTGFIYSSYWYTE